jgi:uncharacterized membrane protein
MRFLKPLAPWLPWLAFLVIAPGSMGRLAAGLLVALLGGAVLAAMRLYRGVLMWAGLSFFALALIAVFGLHNMWFLKHLAVIANAMLAMGAWGSLVLGRPFTIEFARETVDPARWTDPLFIRVNQVITAVWAAVFTFNAAAAWMQTRQSWPVWAGYVVQFGALSAATLFTSWYPKHVRRSVSTAVRAGGVENR